MDCFGSLMLTLAMTEQGCKTAPNPERRANGEQASKFLLMPVRLRTAVRVIARMVIKLLNRLPFILKKIFQNLTAFISQNTAMDLWFVMTSRLFIKLDTADDCPALCISRAKI